MTSYLPGVVICYVVLYLSVSWADHGSDDSYSDNIQVRLSSNGGETSGNEGLVEVFINGAWGGICDHQGRIQDGHYVDEVEGDAICRSMGFSKAVSVYYSANYLFDTWPDRVFMQDLDCGRCYDQYFNEMGHCYALSDCSYDSLVDERCPKDSCLGVECYTNGDGGFDFDFDISTYKYVMIFIVLCIPLSVYSAWKRHQRIRLARSNNTGAVAMAVHHPSSHPAAAGSDFDNDDQRHVSSPLQTPLSYPPPPPGSYPTQTYQTPMPTNANTPWSNDSVPPPPSYIPLPPGTYVGDMPPPPSYDACITTMPDSNQHQDQHQDQHMDENRPV